MRLNNLFLTGLGVAIGCIFNHCANAQAGIRGGINFANVISKNPEGVSAGFTINPGFHLGLTYDISAGNSFVIQPAALFSTKGFQAETENAIQTTASTANAFYVEVPINLIYKPGLGSGRLLLGAGPYVAYGVGGNFKKTTKDWVSEGQIETVKKKYGLVFENDWKDAKDPNTVLYGKPLDYGANLLAGYELKNGLSAQLNAQLGLANLTPAADGVVSDSKFKNVGFGISLGYKF